MSQPIITLLTDFGHRDSYVAQMKAVVIRECPAAVIVDITHLIPPQDILAGSITLWQGINGFPDGSIHVAVVDPGVGSTRKLLLAEIDKKIILLPDNGLITWPLLTARSATVHELTWRPLSICNTFHGRDVLAPVAALLGNGKLTIPQITRPIEEPILLNEKPATSIDDAQVVHIDHYGNCLTNIFGTLLNAASIVEGVGPIRRTYSDVDVGKPAALMSSSGLLEIAIRNGSAVDMLGLAIGSKIKIR